MGHDPDLLARTAATHRVLHEVAAECGNQDSRWGEQNHPNGTGGTYFKRMSNWARERCDRVHSEGRGTWEHILTEEFYEALAESDPAKLRAELIQVAAVAVQWVEALDRRSV